MNENTIIHKLLDLFEYKSEYQRRSSGIPPHDMYILERIHLNKTMTIKELSLQYNIPPSTLTGILDRLEDKNLVQRLRTHADRRAVELAVTDKGNILVDKHTEEDRLFAENLFNSLEKEKKETLKCLLEELLQNVAQEHLFAHQK